ncbi:nucleotidyltransferase family protein [Paenibacillus sp. NFR01]|uniref:nucleotidyltransferase domain-containing protein n=1 Tax=Paenibacillus sp. NFR01 TaxID=1566279 RepID=UPI0008B41D75|nr:nucleotidyltransferase family protein [Paenibacillus sp. NFR01]SEU28427.1 Uncharacterised nucleotidyltransferase [Paenibacillus sp. NFR01]
MTKPIPLNKENLSNELLLLLQLMQGEDAAAASGPDEYAQIDWGMLFQLSLHHRVYPFLYAELKRRADIPVPEEILKRLQQEYRRNTMQMLQLSAEMGSLSRELERLGIPTLFLKGPVLALDLYGDLSLRTSRDLDFLVPLLRHAEAEALLRQLGYVQEESFESVLGDWKWREHHTTFHHPEKKITAEVHWRLSPGPSREPDFADLWARSRTSPAAAHPVHYLGREDLLLYLAAHGARHGWSRLRWLHDIRQLLAQRPDPGTVIRRLRRYGYTAAGGQALILAAELLGAPVDPGLAPLAGLPKARRLAQRAMFYIARRVNLHSPPLAPDVERHYRRYQPAILTLWQQALYYAGFLYPYAADARTLPLPKPLHPLYFLLRPFLWTYRKAFRRRSEA